MMDTGFFKWLWRFNAVVIAAIALIALLAVGYELARDLSRAFFPTRGTNTLAVSPDASPAGNIPDDTVKSYFSAPLGNPRGGVYALPLYVEQQYPNRGISKSSAGNLVNFRIVQTTPQSARWLFTPGERLIPNSTPLVLRQSGVSDLRLGYLLSVVDTDTNADARLSLQDTQTIYLTDADWSAPVKVVDGVRAVLANIPVSDTEMDLIFNTDAGTHVTRVNLQTGEILSEQVITPQD